jgi:hypothetical protein
MAAATTHPAEWADGEEDAPPPAIGSIAHCGLLLRNLLCRGDDRVGASVDVV